MLKLLLLATGAALGWSACVSIPFVHNENTTTLYILVASLALFLLLALFSLFYFRTRTSYLCLGMVIGAAGGAVLLYFRQEWSGNASLIGWLTAILLGVATFVTMVNHPSTLPVHYLNRVAFVDKFKIGNCMDLYNELSRQPDFLPGTFRLFTYDDKQVKRELSETSCSNATAIHADLLPDSPDAFTAEEERIKQSMQRTIDNAWFHIFDVRVLDDVLLGNWKDRGEMNEMLVQCAMSLYQLEMSKRGRSLLEIDVVAAAALLVSLKVLTGYDFLIRQKALHYVRETMAPEWTVEQLRDYEIAVFETSEWLGCPEVEKVWRDKFDEWVKDKPDVLLAFNSGKKRKGARRVVRKG